MLVSRKYDDATAAIACGFGVVLIATGVKPVPESIGYLGVFSFGWGVLALLASAAAATGALLRTRGNTRRAFVRRLWSIRLERTAWPLIGLCTSVFGLGVINQFGIVDAALTVGFTGFVVATCTGHWRAIRASRTEPQR